MGSLTDKLNAIKYTKEEIRTAIESNGVPCSVDEPFSAYPDKILSIDGKVFCSVKDVNFYDYDGTLLYSYWLDEALALTELPPLPKRKGLIAQCWNHTLADIAERNNKCNVGVNYITDDGKTRYYIALKSPVNLTINLSWNQSKSNGVNVDFGDGTPVITDEGTGTLTHTHTYSTVGNYIITFEVVSGNFYPAARNGNTTAIGDDTPAGLAITNCLYKVELGKITIFGGSSMHLLPSCETITIPSNVTSFGGYTFHKSPAFKCIIFPRGVSKLETASLNYIDSLSVVSLPKSITSIGDAVFTDNKSMQEFIMPKYCSSLGTIVFRNCIYMTRFVSCNSLKTIGANCFYGCTAMKEYDFTDNITVPTLENSNAFTGIPDDCVIKVKSSMLNSFKTATNWSVYADYIIGV